MKAPQPYCQICYEKKKSGMDWLRRYFYGFRDPKYDEDLSMECIDKWSKKFKCPRCGTVQIYADATTKLFRVKVDNK